MLNHEFQQHLEGALAIEIVSTASVTGGDINTAWKLETCDASLFLKTNTVSQASAMFSTEAAGLKLLSTTKAILTPEVLTTGTFEGTHYLVLEYIPDTRPTSDFWTSFGLQLSTLHHQTNPEFGLETDNFIGRLPQSNSNHASWSAFYANERLLPQAEMASGSNLLTSTDRRGLDNLLARLPELLPTERPALVHGDLWSGNFLCAEKNTPVLIDPAVYYGHREMDLAMARLFGGFHRDFYRSYEDCAPLTPGFEGRLEIYQLYYLLVHLNLFGRGYHGSVRKILQEFGSN